MYAPRGMGYFGRGMGDAIANCPSMQQLEGVTDPFDPCQVSTVTTGGGGGGGGVSVPANSTCPVGSTCTFFAGVPNTAVYAMGGILAAFLFLGGRR
jgi:hypothetical protein